MAAISSISNISAAQVYQAQQAAPPPKPPKSQSGPQSGQDTVHLSKTALAALQGGDVDHDGDSH